MECKMCLQEEKLCKAHIYPTFLYKRLGISTPDSKGQAKIHKMEYTKDTLKTTVHFTGIYDPNILCSECDNLISKFYENYGVRILFDGVKKEEEYEFEIAETHFRISGIDSSRTKKFILSIFWRASISNKFSSINLTPNENEKLRNILQNNLNIQKGEFGITISFLDMKERELLTGIKKIPALNGHKYSFIAGGMIFTFYPQTNDCPPSESIFLIDENDEMIIRRFPKPDSDAIINTFLYQ